VSIGQDYQFDFTPTGWVIKTLGDNIKKKTIRDNNLYIEEDFTTLIFKPLGFTKDISGNTIAIKRMKICSANTQVGYEIEINSFGKTKIKDAICN